MVTPKLSDSVPPQTARPTDLAPSRLVSWLVTSVIVGWAIAYNVFRFGGRSPHEAAFVSFLVGLGIGAVIFAVSVMVWRRLAAGARVQAHHMNEIPPPARLDGRQRAALDRLWPAAGVLSGVALVVGGLLAVDWWTDDGSRGATRIVIAAWNVLAGAWFAVESVEIRRRHGEAVESVGTAALLTAVLAGVALSRSMAEVAQGTLIVISGVTAALAYFAGWRLLGSRGAPFAAVGAVIVAALAVVLPLAT